MGKVNVYLPDDLEAAVRASGLSISAICQQAVADVVATAQVLGRGEEPRDLDSILSGATRITSRLRSILTGLADDPSAGGPISPHDLFGAVVLHGDNVGATILRMAGVDLPTAPTDRSSRTGRKGRRALAPDAAAVLSAALRVAIEMRHNYIGAEHVVIALAMPPSPLAEMFAALGVDDAQLRRHAERVIGAAPALGRSVPDSTDRLDRLDRLERELSELRDEVRSLAGRGRRRTR